MTWTAHATVNSVGDKDGKIVVHATAKAGDTYESSVPGSTGPKVTLPALVSNTEGAIAEVEVYLHLDAPATSLKAGDRIFLSGHFTNSLPPVPTPAGEAAPQSEASASTESAG